MNEDKNIKTYSLIGAVCSIICSIYFFVRPFSYGATISIYYMVLCVLPYIMIAVLLLLRKKHMMWLIPSGIWLYQTFRQWHWFLFDDTLDCAVAICLILAQVHLRRKATLCGQKSFLTLENGKSTRSQWRM